METGVTGGNRAIGERREMCKDVYVYFNNDGEGNAVRNAASMRSMLNPFG